jgi:hypothetical protein
MFFETSANLFSYFISMFNAPVERDSDRDGAKASLTDNVATSKHAKRPFIILKLVLRSKEHLERVRIPIPFLGQIPIP